VEIKRKADLGDVLTCQPCIGSEGLEVVGDLVCRIREERWVGVE
jgi:hypothetical protein